MLELAPGHVTALCGRGKVQCQLNNMTLAQDLFRAALQRAPRDWPTLSNFGVMLVRHVGDLDNGRRLLDRAVSSAPNPSVRQMLGPFPDTRSCMRCAMLGCRMEHARQVGRGRQGAGPHRCRPIPGAGINPKP